MKLRRAFALSLVSAAGAAAVTACGWDPSRPFEREAPQVNEALGKYDAGEAGAAADLLEEYLQTGACKEGNIGLPLRVRERSNGSFDLGLALFRIAEAYGQRFGDEEVDGGPKADPNAKAIRTAHVDCALRVVRAIAEDSSQQPAIRARARYLEGNLLFLNADYKEAVTAYDHTLAIIPGMGDAGPLGMDAGRSVDGLGRDAAWNRAVALRRIEDKKDAGQPDASPPTDGGNEGDSGKNDDDKKKDGGSNDEKNKDAGKNDKGKDGGNDSDPPKKDPPKDEPDAGGQPPPPPSRQSQDDRILDQLENAPTVQQEAAKKQGRARKVRSMTDK